MTQDNRPAVGCRVCGYSIYDNLARKKWNHRVPSPIEQAARELNFALLKRLLTFTGLFGWQQEIKKLNALEQALKESGGNPTKE